ncbi:hypothetical protein A0J61_04348 [Choanephora cucurbitarum]|uniref:Uncharacterized protein n=1 Tax=Choanephora cucurbitarum TaxID=101091 RepID=A0A1C7NEU4_9FUNG|nr:hypothetical protein A0J61_04348 [Choanephora cucurbitarum]
MMHGYRQQEPYWYNPQRSYSAHNHPTYRKRRSSRQRKPSKYKVIYEEDVFPDHPQVYPYDTSQPYRGPDQVSWLDPVSPYMMQSTGPPWPPHLNQPVITFDPMMMHFYPPQHLDTRATELLYPAHVLYDQAQRLPMMQPYFMPTGLPPNLASHFLDPMPFMDVASSKVDEPPSPDSQEKLEEVRPKSMAPSTSPIEPPQPLRRRLSLMESLLDSFSLLNEPKVMSQTSYQEMDPSTSESSGSNDEVKEEPKLIDRRPSLSRKLSKKANALQSRQFIWCYRLRDTEGALWTAFDVKNQSTLDKQYALLVSKKQQQQQNSDGSLNDEDITYGVSEYWHCLVL